VQAPATPADNRDMRQATFNLIIAAVIAIAAFGLLSLYV
jgi:hypothetical protein